jgi:hypothetical protein
VSFIINFFKHEVRAVADDTLIVVCTMTRVVREHGVAPERVVLVERLELV